MCGYGLDLWQDGWCFGVVLPRELFEEGFGDSLFALAAGGFDEAGWWGQWAESGIEGDLFDGGFGVGGWGGFGEIEAGDLEAVEEQAGAAGVDVVGGDALEDFADGVLDGGAVFRVREVEGAAFAFAAG